MTVEAGILKSIGQPSRWGTQAWGDAPCWGRMSSLPGNHSSHSSDLIGWDPPPISRIVWMLLSTSWPGHRMCGSHQPKRDPELSDLKFCCIRPSKRMRPSPQGCRRHHRIPRDWKGRIGSLDNHVLTAPEVAGRWAWQWGSGLHSTQEPRRRGRYVHELLPES